MAEFNEPNGRKAKHVSGFPIGCVVRWNSVLGGDKHWKGVVKRHLSETMVEVGMAGISCGLLELVDGTEVPFYDLPGAKMPTVAADLSVIENYLSGSSISILERYFQEYLK